jgi:hypothetical protein
VNIDDAVRVLEFLFVESSVVNCLKAADGNDDGRLNIADAVSILGYLFGGAGPLPLPFDACGYDPTADYLCGCSSSCP